MNTPRLTFGWDIVPYTPAGRADISLAQRVTQTLARVHGRFAVLWMADHFFYDHYHSREAWECWTAIAYLAGMFPQMRFGTLVLSQSYRHPALLAKMAATLHYLSGGRLILGIGAGWKEVEYRAYGYDFPTIGVRMAQLEEAVHILRAMWTEPEATFHGQHYRIERAYCEPKPNPPIPLLIGGGGEKRTLRLAAQYADWCNIVWPDVPTFRHKLAVLRGHCDAVGRSYDDIVKSVCLCCAVAPTEEEARRIAADYPTPFRVTLIGTPEQVATELRQYAHLGAQHVMLVFADFPHTTAGIELFAEAVIPQCTS